MLGLKLNQVSKRGPWKFQGLPFVVCGCGLFLVILVTHILQGEFTGTEAIKKIATVPVK